jgi:hypothetical protein
MMSNNHEILRDFDKQELEIRRLVGIIVSLKAASYHESPETIVEKLRKVVP